MNKEIKFRAWNKKRQGWFSLENSITFEVEGWGVIPNKDVKLMQFTGLKDKNGKEIYEGDVVNHGHYTDNKKPCNFIIYWDEKHSGFMEKEIRDFNTETLIDNKDCEVIGNIYENPELTPSSIKRDDITDTKTKR